MTTVGTKTETYLDEPPAYDFTEVSSADRKEIIAEARSIDSSSTDLTVVGTTEFNVTKTLLVNARGIRLLRLPVPSGELEIPITSTTGDLVYLSTRQKRCSGNATLSDASGKELLASEYQFGPGREPKLHILERGDAEDAIITTKGKWTSRAQEFVLPDGRTFTWRYVKELHSSSSNSTLDKPKKRTFLVLEAPLGSESSPINKGKKAEKRRLAKLVRDEEARTPGTRSSDAGNGGELKMDGEAILSSGLRQDIVVSTLLMMLKKEIDRRRMVQFMVLAAAAGS